MTKSEVDISPPDRAGLRGVRISPAVRKAWGGMVALRRDLHRHPELGFEETRTAALVADRLREWGYEVREGVAGTGVIGNLRGGAKGRGRIVAIRADMDALPIRERGGREYRSRNEGVMHACGHDGHVAIALEVARQTALGRDRLRGGVKFLFQPAEEGPGGAFPMIEAGALEHPRVDAILGLHLWNHLRLGRVGVRGGPMMASVDIFRLKVTGRGGHGAAPHRTVDAILAASRVVDALQSVVSRSVDPREPAVLSIGTIEGGAAFNVIAEEVVMTGTTRAYDEDVRRSFPSLIRRVAGGVARAHGARARLEYTWQYPSLENDPSIARVVADAAGGIVGPAGVVDPGLQMVSEDMAFYLREVPGCFFYVGAHDPRLAEEVSHHSPRFDFDERAMLVGVEVFLRAIGALTGDAVRKRLRRGAGAGGGRDER